MPRFISFILPLLFVTAQAEDAPLYTSSSALGISYIVKAFLFIILLLVFMYYWYRYLLPKIQSQSGLTSNLCVREKLVLEPGTALYVLDIKDEYKLLVVSNKNTACYDLSGKNLRYLPAEKKDFSKYLAEMIKTKNVKKGQKNVKK